MRKLMASAAMPALILVSIVVVLSLALPCPVSSSAASQPWLSVPSLLLSGVAATEQSVNISPNPERVPLQVNMANVDDAISLASEIGNEPTALDCTSLSNWQCVETRPGLSLCRANNICVVKVDLNNAAIRPRVVVAPGGGTAYVSSMAASAGAFAAINGDYFSPGGCPDNVSPLNCGQGLTYIDGTDYTDYRFDNWQNRRSLGFNDSNDPNIGWPGEQGGYHRQLLGGGPQVTFSGEFRWRCWYSSGNTDGNCDCRQNAEGNWVVVINDEQFSGCSAASWWETQQTLVGFSDDRNTLYLAKTEPGSSNDKTMREMHDVLWVMGARHSLRMDGGGSSSMYYNDGGYSFAWDGEPRAVANAWVIVANSTPPPIGNWNARYDQGSTLWWDPNAQINPRCTETISGPELHKNWGSAAPCGGMNGDDWVGDFYATINFASGDYVFQLDHDDGVKLWLNGQNIQERGGSGSGPVCPPRYLSGEEDLRVILREEGGDARINVTWTTDAGVCDSESPVVHWVAPVTDQQVYSVSGGTVQLEVSATDNVGVNQVSFVRWDAVNEVWVDIATDYSSPYQASLDVGTLNLGWNQVNAYAFDGAGNSATEYIWIDRATCYSLTTSANPSAGGTIVANPGPNCGTGYTSGSQVQLTANSNSGYTFANWSGDASGSNNPTTITMNSSKNVTANFAACSDPHEPNDTAGQATTMSYGDTMTDPGICPAGDVDYYAFTGSAGDRIVADVDAQAIGSTLDSYLYLYDTDGVTELTHNDNSDGLDSRIVHVLPADGTYYLMVREYSHPDEGGTDYFYSISLSEVPPPVPVDANWTLTAPTADGQMSVGEWDDAATYDITTASVQSVGLLATKGTAAVLLSERQAARALAVPESPLATTTLYVMNDDTHLYVAIDNPNDTAVDTYDQMGVYFDDNPLPSDGQWTNTTCGHPEGEGNFWAITSTVKYREWIAGPSQCAVVQPAPGSGGAVGHVSGHAQAEIALNLSSSALRAAPGDAINMYLWIYDAGPGTFDGQWPAVLNFQDPSTYGVLTLASCTEPGMPSLSSPANGSSTWDTTPTFSWDSVSGATSYRIQADNNSDFSSPEIDTTTSSSSYTPATDLPDDTYFWRVQASNTCGTGPWSAPWQVTINTPMGADVSIHQSLLSGTSEPGTALTYRLEYANLGDQPASDVWIIDSLPAEVSYVNSTGPVVPIIEGQVARWDLGTLDPGASGEISVTVRIADGVTIGTWLDNVVQISTADAETEAHGSGLEGSYYQYNPEVIGVPPNDPFANGILKLRRTDPSVDFVWNSASPQPGILYSDHFAVRWAGYVYASQSGLYTFATVTDDGARLWVNGSQLVDDWTQHAMETHSGQIELEVGQWYPLQFDFEDGNGGAAAQLMWQRPGDSELTIIPQQYLSPQATAANNQSDLGLSVQSASKASDLLLVLDYGGHDTDWFRPYFTSTLEELGHAYDVWDTEIQGAPDEGALMQYLDGAVVWTAPYWGYVIYNDTFNNLQSYLDAGGRLFLTSQDTGFYLNDWGNTGFLNGYLHADFVQSDTDLLTLLGTPDDPISDGHDLSLADGDGADNQGSPDEVDPIPPAMTVFTYDGTEQLVLAEPDGFRIILPESSHSGSEAMTQANPRSEVKGSRARLDGGEEAGTVQGVISSGTAGLRVDTGAYKVVYFSFGFEGIDNAGDRAIVMDRVLAWLWGVLARPLQISPEDGSELPYGEIAFLWHPVVGAAGYQIQMDKVETFDSPDLISETIGSSGYTSTPEPGTWHWRVRALPDGEYTPIWQVAVQPLVPPSVVTIAGPNTGWVSTSYIFTATVSPSDTALPVTYVWQAGEQDPVTHTGGLSDTVAFTWASAGDKVVSVEASNAGGSVSDNTVITIDEAPPEFGTLSFDVDLQGRSDDSGAWITASSGGQPVQWCVTSSEGTCSMMVPPGFYDGDVVMSSYLNSVWCTVEVRAGEITSVPPIELRGGDVNDDCVINILDLTPMGSHFGSQCGDPDWDPRLDINADCVLNIQDLAIAGGNFGRQCPDICIQKDAAHR